MSMTYIYIIMHKELTYLDFKHFQKSETAMLKIFNTMKIEHYDYIAYFSLQNTHIF